MRSVQRHAAPPPSPDFRPPPFSSSYPFIAVLDYRRATLTPTRIYLALTFMDGRSSQSLAAPSGACWHRFHRQCEMTHCSPSTALAARLMALQQSEEALAAAQRTNAVAIAAFRDEVNCSEPTYSPT